MTTDEYFKHAKSIWKNLVPKSGPADSLQGELLRYNEKLRDEAHRNGNINWRSEHADLAHFMQKTLVDSGLFPPAVISKIDEAIQELLDFEYPNTSDGPYDYIMERIVDWHLAQDRIVPLSEVEGCPGFGEAPAATAPTGEPSPLRQALNSRDRAAVLKALADGGDTEEKEPDFGKTLLFGFAARGWQDMIELLLDQGAQINAIDQVGLSVLDMAIYHPEVYTYLQSRGALSAQKGELS